MPKPPAEPPKPRRMMAAASCWDDGCPHVAGEHYEIRNVPGQPEVYYQDLCEYHKCQPVPNATAWVCVVDKDFTFNAGIATNVRVLPLPSREELGKIAWDALFPGYIPEYERYESIGASIYRALGVSE
jgi:hypothetical protein